MISTLKKQFNNDYRVIVVSHLPSVSFKGIDKSNDGAEYETLSDGILSSGRVFYYECKEEDTKDTRREIFKRVSNGRSPDEDVIDTRGSRVLRVYLPEDCYIVESTFVEYINKLLEFESKGKCVSFMKYKVSSYNNQLHQTDKRKILIRYKDYDKDEDSGILESESEEVLLCNKPCIIELSADNKSKLTGLIDFYKNKHFDQESKDLLPEGCLDPLYKNSMLKKV
jgi:hypothetical protein